MTIFLEISKIHLKKAITKIRNKSASADESLTNKFLSIFNMGRDPDLSGNKRDLADELIQRIVQMSPQNNDFETKSDLIKIIDEYKKKARFVSAKKKYDEGNFGPGMEKIIILVNDFYNKLNEAGLTDIPHDDNPLNQFRYHMGRYLLQKVVDSRNRGVIQSVMVNPKVSASLALCDQKEQLVLNILADCAEDLKTLDTKHPQYKIARRNRVIEWIEKLMRKNIDLCEEHSTSTSVPVRLSFLATVNVDTPTIGPDAGFLEICLQNACEEIRPDKYLRVSGGALSNNNNNISVSECQI